MGGVASAGTLGYPQMPADARLYIDDSGKPDQSPVLVLAGYLSTNEKWARFADEWNALLLRYDIDAFHMAEAWRLARPYKQIGALRRNNLIIEAIECIKRHVLHAFVVSIKNKDFHDFLDLKGDPRHFLGRPYNCLFWTIMTLSYQRNYRFFYDRRLQVVFDEQSEPVHKITSVHDEFVRLASQDFPGLEIPRAIFASDKDEVPIQASDLLAWLVNRQAANMARGTHDDSSLESLFLAQALSMDKTILIWDTRRLAVASQDLLRRLSEA